MAYTETVKRLLQQSDYAYRAIQPDMSQALTTALHAKPAKEKRLLHAMDNLDELDVIGVGTVELSDRVLYEGRKTVQFNVPAQVVVTPGSLAKTKIFGDSHLMLRIPCEDWREYNRLSFWIYPDLPTYDNVFGGLHLVNDRQEDYDISGLLGDSMILQLESGKWNYVVWEIPNTHRDRIAGVQIRVAVDGRQAGSDLWKSFYYGPVHLEKVDAEYYEGWDTQDRIAFCHSGYQPGAVKRAYTQNTGAEQFELLRAGTDEAVYSGKVRPVATTLGDFCEMDFTGFDASGEYELRVDGRRTGAFVIDEEAFASSIWKAINFFYQERCGCMLAGTHRVCHLDTFTKHPDGRRLSASGGWHDAGDLSQGLCNTSESAHAMMDLAMQVKGSDVPLYERLLDEARWGLEWCMKTRFGDGYRARWTTIGTWTGNIVGDMDDIELPASNDPFENFCAAAAEAAGARVFADIDSGFAAYCLRCAQKDFGFALERVYTENTLLQHIAEGAVAAGELYRVTKDSCYLDTAAGMLGQVLAGQQQEYPDWEKPIRGFFYETLEKKHPVNYPHRAHDQAFTMGLAIWLECAPEHPDAPKWKKGLELYAEFIKSIVSYNEPYGAIPGVYRIEKDENERAYALNGQILNGVKLSEEYYLRRMPVAYDYRGFNGVMLTKAKAASVAARALNDQELNRIAQRQVEWVVGMNPFMQSTMYGEGYRYPELFVMFSHQIVGAIPVGIWTDGDHDLPYFPHMNNATYKEVWVHPTARFMWVLADVYGSARVCGRAKNSAVAVNEKGEAIELSIADGRFEAALPQGRYELIIDGVKSQLDAIGGGRYCLNVKEA